VPRVLHIIAAFAVVLALAIPASGQITVYVFADDGTPLATDVYRPLRSSPHPVILIRTPYGRDGWVEPCLAFALLGYACVAQDTRGRGDSGGDDTVFRDDADDGRATVEWLAEQSWCDGNIGMFGGSAFAITQYLPAPGADAALRSIAPVVATPDLYHDAFLQGGAIREALAVNWLNGQDSGFFYDEVLDHRLKDAWWDAVEVLEHAGSIHTAGLHIGGWYDIFGQGAKEWWLRGGWPPAPDHGTVDPRRSVHQSHRGLHLPVERGPRSAQHVAAVVRRNLARRYVGDRELAGGEGLPDGGGG